jgi:AcrR family transcriptional regulator
MCFVSIMPRDREKTRRRLQRAALELYCEHGYDQTTAADIAARAGVTERTFFRHFPDKREVLFEGETKLRTAMMDAIAKAPRTLGPLETLSRAFQSVEPIHEENRPFLEARREVIASTPALYEREVAKLAASAVALASALQQRGIDDRLATLAAQTGIAAFGHAAMSWHEDSSTSLKIHIARAFDELRALVRIDDSPPSLTVQEFI